MPSQPQTFKLNKRVACWLGAVLIVSAFSFHYVSQQLRIRRVTNDSIALSKKLEAQGVVSAADEWVFVQSDLELSGISSSFENSQKLIDFIKNNYGPNANLSVIQAFLGACWNDSSCTENQKNELHDFCASRTSQISGNDVPVYQMGPLRWLVSHPRQSDVRLFEKFRDSSNTTLRIDAEHFFKNIKR